MWLRPCSPSFCPEMWNESLHYMLYKEYEGILIIKTLMPGTNTGYKSSVLVPQHVQNLMFTAPTPLGHRLCSKMAQASATISLATLPCWNCRWRKSEMSSYQTSGTRYVVMGVRNHRMLFNAFHWLFIYIYTFPTSLHICKSHVTFWHQNFIKLTHRRLLIPSEMTLATDVAWSLTWKRLSHPTNNVYPGNYKSGRWANCLSKRNRQNQS